MHGKRKVYFLVLSGRMIVTDLNGRGSAEEGAAVMRAAKSLRGLFTKSERLFPTICLLSKVHVQEVQLVLLNKVYLVFRGFSTNFLGLHLTLNSQQDMPRRMASRWYRSLLFTTWKYQYTSPSRAVHFGVVVYEPLILALYCSPPNEPYGRPLALSGITVGDQPNLYIMITQKSGYSGGTSDHGAAGDDSNQPPGANSS